MTTRAPRDPVSFDLGRFVRTYRQQALAEQGGTVGPDGPAVGPVSAARLQATAPEAPDDAERAAAFRVLVQRANTETPDAATRAAARAFFDQAPAAWEALGNLAQIAAGEVVRGIAPTWLRGEAIARVAQALRDELGYQDAPALERTLIDHVVLCWVRLQRAEITYTRSMAAVRAREQADYWERRLTATQRRYLRAVETLARVRRLLRPVAPPVQVNIAAAGGQQVTQGQAPGTDPLP